MAKPEVKPEPKPEPKPDPVKWTISPTGRWTKIKKPARELREIRQ